MQRIKELIEEINVLNELFIENYPKTKISDWSRVTKMFHLWYADYKKKETNIPTTVDNNWDNYLYEVMMYPYNVLTTFKEECSEYLADEYSIDFMNLNLEDLENNINEAYNIFSKNNIEGTQEIIQQLLQPTESIIANGYPRVKSHIVRRHLISYENYYKNRALETLCFHLCIHKSSEEYRTIKNIINSYLYNRNEDMNDILCLYRENYKVLEIFDTLRNCTANINNEIFDSVERIFRYRLIRLKYELLMNPDKYIYMKNFIGVFFNL